MRLLMIVTLFLYAMVSFLVDGINRKVEMEDEEWFIDPVTNEFVEVERF